MLTRLIIAAAVCSLLALTLAAAPQPAPVETRPLVQLVGHDSKIAQPRFVLVRTEEQWLKLWAEHAAVPAEFSVMTRHAAPKVDFSRCLVVGSFSGLTTNTDGLVARTISTTPDAVRIRFEASTFQTARFDGKPDTGTRTSPFGIWIIDLPTPGTPIILEQAKRVLKADRVQWEEVKRFDGK